MGCNCNKKKQTRTTQTFRLVMPDGRQSDHGSALEAQAENARKGGGGKVQTK